MNLISIISFEPAADVGLLGCFLLFAFLNDLEHTLVVLQEDLLRVSCLQRIH